jgi:hypothetical protein
MKHFFLFGLLGLTLGIGSCKKWSSKKSFVIDQNFRSYFNFKNGSEWAYTLESDTTIIETVKLVGYMEGKTVWDAFDQEFIQYDLVSDRDSMYKLRAIADEDNVVNTSLLVRDTFFRIAAQWYYLYNTFTGITGTGDTFTFYSNYLQKGKTYTDVIELKPKSSKYFKSLAMARNVGIIRKNMVSGKNYVLKSYKVQ